MALRWVAAEPGIMQVPILDIDRAQDWPRFTAALARWPGPGSNFVYADVDGNIGYHAAGKLPNRHGYNGDLPVDGSSGDFEWDGVHPLRPASFGLNPAQRDHCHGQSESVSAGLPAPRERQFRRRPIAPGRSAICSPRATGGGPRI